MSRIQKIGVGMLLALVLNNAFAGYYGAFQNRSNSLYDTSSVYGNNIINSEGSYDDYNSVSSGVTLGTDNSSCFTTCVNVNGQSFCSTVCN